MQRRNVFFAAILLIAVSRFTSEALAGEPIGAIRARDVTWFAIGDPHLGAQEKGKPARTKEQIAEEALRKTGAIVSLIGKPYPPVNAFQGIDRGTVLQPRGLLIAGDLTDNLRWDAFEAVFPTAGLHTSAGRLTVFACLGNHDGDAEGASRQGFIARNRALARAGKLGVLSVNGLHYALNWDGVHMVCLSPYPADAIDREAPFKYGRPGPGSWNDPQGGLTFLRDYLRNKVGRSGEPVVLMHHYGFDSFSTNDWNWWTPKQRRALYETIQPYHVVAIIHGHEATTRARYKALIGPGRTGIAPADFPVGCLA